MSYYESESYKNTIDENLFTHEAEFVDCDFQSIDFQNINLERIKFIECRFDTCNLSNTSLQYGTLRDVSFSNCKLLGVNWTSLNSIFDINFHKCNLNLCVFSGLDFKSSKFTESICHQTDFSQGNFEKALFMESDLKDASFAGANLQGANFEGAKNYFIDLKEVRVKGAKFSFPEASTLLEAQGLKIKI